MMNAKRPPLKRAEKVLFLTPLLVLVGGLASWWLSANRSGGLTFRGATTAYRFAFSPDGKRLAVLPGDNRAAIYDAVTLSEIRKLQIPQDVERFAEVSWSPDGEQIVACYEAPLTMRKIIVLTDGRVALWDAKTGRLRRTMPYPSWEGGSVADARFSKDGRKLLGTGTPPGVIDPVTGRQLQQFNVDSYEISEAKFNESDGLVAVLADDSQAKVFGKKTFEVRGLNDGRLTWRAKSQDVRDFDWSNNGLLGFISAEAGGRKVLRLWDAKLKREILGPRYQSVDRFLFGSGSLLAVVETGQQKINQTMPSMLVTVQDLSHGSVVWQQNLWGDPQTLKWSPNGKNLVVTGQSEKKPHVWVFDAVGDLVLDSSEWSTSSVIEAKWSPDSRTLAVADEDSINFIPTQETQKSGADASFQSLNLNERSGIGRRRQPRLP